MLQRNIRHRLKFLSLLEEILLASVCLATMDQFSLTARQDQGKHSQFQERIHIKMLEVFYRAALNTSSMRQLRYAEPQCWCTKDSPILHIKVFKKSHKVLASHFKIRQFSLMKTLRNLMLNAHMLRFIMRQYTTCSTSANRNFR